MDGGLAVTTALWLGFLTSISPCPLATNAAAVTYLARRVDRPGLAVVSGLLYTSGRVFVYTVLGAILASSLLSAMDLATFLQGSFNRVLGPVLVLVGLVLLRVIRVPGVGSGKLTEAARNRFADAGWIGAFLLGVAFALAFCPVSAALFFLSLVPLAVEHDSPVLLPAAYGLGTAATVWVLSGLAAFGAARVGRALDRITAVETWLRRITGVAFVVAGILESYYAWIQPW